MTTAPSPLVESTVRGGGKKGAGWTPEVTWTPSVLPTEPVAILTLEVLGPGSQLTLEAKRANTYLGLLP